MIKQLFITVLLSLIPFVQLQYSCMKYLNAYFLESQSLTIVELQGGLSDAKNYKVISDGREYVLRILNPKTSLEARQREIIAAVHAGERGVGPFIHYFSPKSDALIMDFISGHTLEPSSIKEKEKFSTLLQIIRQLHDSPEKLPQGNTNFDIIRGKIEKFSLSNSPVSLELINKALIKLQAIEKKFEDQPLVPCHNDLNALNIIEEEGGFKLIDWTDFSMGYAYNDLGHFVLANGIQEEQYQELLSFYLRRLPSNGEIALLKLAKEVASLRVFVMVFFDFLELPPISPEERAKFEQILGDPNLPEMEYFSDLHRKGKLNNKEMVVHLGLSALRSFLTNNERDL